MPDAGKAGGRLAYVIDDAPQHLALPDGERTVCLVYLLDVLLEQRPEEAQLLGEVEWGRVVAELRHLGGKGLALLDRVPAAGGHGWSGTAPPV